jgi:transcription antitermination factor NusG
MIECLFNNVHARKKNWYAIYTKPRWEKKTYNMLLEKGIESYCPLNKVKKKWSDRIKLVEEPLFKSYVFVKLSEDEKTSVRYINGVVNFVYWLGKPAIIRNREIERIRQFLNEYTNVTVEPLELQPGTKVIIKAGVMMDKEAKVVKDRRTYVEVEIESLGCKLKALIQKKHMDLIP